MKKALDFDVEEVEKLETSHVWQGEGPCDTKKKGDVSTGLGRLGGRAHEEREPELERGHVVATQRGDVRPTASAFESGGLEDALRQGERFAALVDGLAITRCLASAAPTRKVRRQEHARGVDAQAQADHEASQGVHARDVSPLVQKSCAQHLGIGALDKACIEDHDWANVAHRVNGRTRTSNDDEADVTQGVARSHDIYDLTNESVPFTQGLRERARAI